MPKYQPVLGYSGKTKYIHWAYRREKNLKKNYGNINCHGQDRKKKTLQSKQSKKIDGRFKIAPIEKLLYKFQQNVTERISIYAKLWGPSIEINII